MSNIDLIMDMETLGKVLTRLSIPKEQFFNYSWLLTNLKETSIKDSDNEAALKLVTSIMKRLQ